MLRRFAAILLIVCTLFSSAAAEALPQAIQDLLTYGVQFAQRYTVDDFYQLNDEECFVLLRDSANSLNLCLFQFVKGAWRTKWSNQLLSTPSSASLVNRTKEQFTLRHPAEGDAAFEIDFRLQGKEWMVTRVLDREMAMTADVYSTRRFNGVHYQSSDSGLGYLQFSTQSYPARTFQLGKLSYLTKDLSQMFDSSVPSFPMKNFWGSTHVYLRQKMRLPVYSGPAETYKRGVEGRAALGCSEPFTVLGKTGDWLMVLYSIKPGHFRVGYIDYTVKDSLTNVAYCVDELDFTSIRGVFTNRDDVPLYDDPVHATRPLARLPEGREATVLAQDDKWCYVEISAGSHWARGFILKTDLTDF